MKHFTLLSIIAVSALLTANVVTAQSPVITSTNQLHSIGDNVVYVDANIPFGFDIMPAGGANQVWNYPTLTSSGSTTFSYEDPSTAVGSSNFPSANEAMANTAAAGHEWFETNSTMIKRLGYTDPSLGDIYYDNGGFVRYQFPFEAGDSWNTILYTANTTLNLSGMPTTIDNGTYSAYVDAYGTLTLPSGVITDVVRVHAQESFDLLVDIGIGTPFNAGSVYDDYYFWFVDGIMDPVMTYGATDQAPAPLSNPNSTKVLRYQDIATGIIQTANLSGFAVYPNPSNGVFQVSANDLKSGNYIMEVSNILGKTVSSQNVFVSNASLSQTLDVSELTAGVYFISISNSDYRATQKVIIE